MSCNEKMKTCFVRSHSVMTSKLWSWSWKKEKFCEFDISEFKISLVEMKIVEWGRRWWNFERTRPSRKINICDVRLRKNLELCDVTHSKRVIVLLNFVGVIKKKKEKILQIYLRLCEKYIQSVRSSVASSRCEHASSAGVQPVGSTSFDIFISSAAVWTVQDVSRCQRDVSVG